jgi:uncharacterized protein
MNEPDFEAARQYALERLANELPTYATYHCIAHTRDHVTPTVELFAELEGVKGMDLILLLTAAYFHDIGFVESCDDHEEIGVRIVSEVLPEFGYLPEHIQVITRIIMSTKLPQSPSRQLEKIMADADLDSLGRTDFFDRNQDLRNEMAALGRTYSDEEWYRSQYRFIHEHHYFTESARNLRRAQKQKNIATLSQLLKRFEASGDSVSEVDMPVVANRLDLLRSVSVFQNTPANILSNVAAVLSEVNYAAGETIFIKGDYGDSMYIIADGKVKVHDGELIYNYLEPLDVFGEMSALDPKVRSASVTAVGDTRLFQLSQSALNGLMARRSEVGLGIIKVLCQRLRDRTQDMSEDFEYMQQFAKLTAAAVALEEGVYKVESLDEVAERTDELGNLARVFQRMERQVRAREQRLKQEVAQLKIEIDQAKQAQQVAEITETEYFQYLSERARNLREKKGGAADE